MERINRKKFKFTQRFHDESFGTLPRSNIQRNARSQSVARDHHNQRRGQEIYSDTTLPASFSRHKSKNQGQGLCIFINFNEFSQTKFMNCNREKFRLENENIYTAHQQTFHFVKTVSLNFI